MRDEKYVVFSRTAYNNYLPSQGEAPPPEIEDAVVIRTQDIFAAPALYAYANCISTCIEILSQTDDYPTPLLTRLREISDYFMDRGDEADNHHSRKVPD